MKLVVCSDLHLEFYNNAPKLIRQLKLPDADVLCLNGDIGHPNSILKDFLIWAKSRYRIVLYVPGNHEFYGQLKAGCLPRTTQLQTLCESCGVIWMSRRAEVIDGITFIGCTLWTRLIEGHGMNDVGAVFETMDDYNAEHDKDKEWLRNALTIDYKSDDSPSDQNKKFVIMTHHLPTPRTIHPRFQGRNNSGYCSETFEELDKDGLLTSVKLWLFGHTHEYVNSTHEYDASTASNASNASTVRLYANPFGYPGEKRETVFHREVLTL